ncbi:fibro-slime domain-containing protein [Fibrobacter sp.]|uniref:fibro-slime domain-containing protein n=1 Tax=Fibrobacter sp. TaxID=35828 RepID=UPI0025BE4436|nr:fibro-slime domain-containing protein [Fibrobacter sp.]MBR3071789.1 fibro-slime domain-containing protein [Fibrobacter sp.]
MKIFKTLITTIAACTALSASFAWADLKKSQTGDDVCSPKIHFKLPKGWSDAYLMIAGQGIAFPKPRLGDNGWTMLDLGNTKTDDDSYFYISGVNKNDCSSGKCVTRNGVNVRPNNARIEGFSCKDVGADGEIWIQELPDSQKEGQVYVTTQKPNIKEFYVFLPETAMWYASMPIIEEDGKPHEMEIDADHCGWYVRRYVDEALPQSVIIYSKNDSGKKRAIGMGGEKALNEGKAAEPIVLADLFELFKTDRDYHDAVYFLADEKQADALGSDTYGWSAVQPIGAVGNCSFVTTFIIYDTDASLHPSFSCWGQGGEGCQAASGTAAQGVDKATALKAINDCMGVTTGIVESTLDSKTKKPKLSAAGKKCFMDEKYFNQLFNYTEGVNEMSCYDMQFSLSKDGKWEFDSDNIASYGLKTPVKGGFYPVEATSDKDLRYADSLQKPLPAARTKRTAEGPVYWGPELRKTDPAEQLPVINLFCNGAGWDKGFNCNGLFADGESTETFVKEKLNLDPQACVFGWSCDDDASAPEGWSVYAIGTETSSAQAQGENVTHRWTSEVGKDGNGGRNQHFCAETHATFRFSKGQKFSISGNDDIWVFIDNKLAIDIGGTHLTAPGYVDLDKFMPNAIVDSLYDIDIFTCDRRTTSSNLSIKTNIPLANTGDILESLVDSKITDSLAMNENYRIGYKKSLPCIASPRDAKIIEYKPKTHISEPIRFIFTKDKTGQDSTQILISEADFEANPKQFCEGDVCGINVSTPDTPIINDEKLKQVYAPGEYYLVVKVGDHTIAIDVDLENTMGVANRRIALDAPSFNILKMGTLEFAIVTSEPNNADRYAVMDMKGQVLSAGTLNSNETRIKVSTAGAYIVKVGSKYKQVHMK